MTGSRLDDHRGGGGRARAVTGDGRRRRRDRGGVPHRLRGGQRHRSDPQFAVLDLAGCEDRGRSDPRLRPARSAGAGSTEGDAVAVRDLLVDGDFTTAESSRFSDGIDAADDRWTVAVNDGDVTVRVFMYRDRPYVLVDAIGRCLPVTEEERVRYNGLDPLDLDVTS